MSCFCMTTMSMVAQNADTWDKVWLNPPVSASPGCYYYWDNGNISKEGITKDLEAMKSIGIDEPFVTNVVGRYVKPGSVKVFSEDWWSCMVHAANEAKRLGMHIGYFNCPGWSQSGGPWVKPTETMRYLVSGEAQVVGGKNVNFDVKELFDSVARPMLQLVTVQAFPMPLYDDFKFSDLHPSVVAENLGNAYKLFDGSLSTSTQSKTKDSKITLTLKRKETFRSLQVYPADRILKGYVILEYQTEEGEWRKVCRMQIDRNKLDEAVGPMVQGPLTANFPEVTASKFRFTFHTDLGIKLREIVLNKAARLACSTEKQLGKLWPYPEVTATCYDWPKTVQPSNSSLTIPTDKIIDLTSYVDGHGRLTWKSPKGKWVILVTAMKPTEVFNSPCPPEASGYEIDKMNRKIAEAHVDSFIGKLMQRIPVESRDAVKHIVADSYEKGSENWTEGMAEAFKTRYGYNPIPYLPALTGRIVGDAEHSERFLWDLRRLVADRIATEYIGGLRDRGHHYGLRLWIENYGHWGYPGEFLNYGGASDEVSGEYWISKPQRGPVEVRCASSAAHIYGKERVSCESFTDSGTNFNTEPEKLKTRGDWAMCQGVNHYVLHVYLHQPDDRKPGVSAWFGTDFNRNNTWFSRGKSWVDYIRRSCALLQQGRPVADIAYFIGENTPKMTGEQTPAMPKGYDFDFINSEVLLNATMGKDGRICLPSGTSYAVLVLPSEKTMRPATAKKIVELMKQGAKVVGNVPQASPSLENYPLCDTVVVACAKQMASEILSPSVPLDETLHRLGCIEDCSTPDDIIYTHRQGEGKHIYFLSNQRSEVKAGNVSFRVTGMQPELWDAVSGERRELTEFTVEKDRTVVPLRFEKNGSWFVVFRKSLAKVGKKQMENDQKVFTNNNGKLGHEVVSVVANFRDLTTKQELNSKWKVTFKPTYTQAFEKVFDKLEDWRLNPDSAVKYFSGKAIYATTFKVKHNDEKLYLDLGKVNGMATVRINGVELPTLWTYPFRLSIADYVKKGSNWLEIEVVNCWWNRLAGDAKLPIEQRVTWTPNRIVNAKSHLLPSGLLGPVTLQTVE